MALTRFPKVVAVFTYTKAVNPLRTKLNGAILAAIRPHILALRDAAQLEEKIKFVELGGNRFEYYPKVACKPGYAFTNVECASVESARLLVIDTLVSQLTAEGATDIVIVTSEALCG